MMCAFLLLFEGLFFAAWIFLTVCWIILFIFAIISGSEALLIIFGIVFALALFAFIAWFITAGAIIIFCGLGLTPLGFTGERRSPLSLRLFSRLFGNRLPSTPNLPSPCFGTEFGLMELLLLSPDQLSKLPPDVLVFAKCFRKCLISSLCKEAGAGDDPGRVIVDAGKSLLEDLRSQLEAALQKLEEARQQTDFIAIAYWTAKITDLNERIASLGG